MTIEELFQRLSYGELSNLADGVEATGTIRKDKQNRLVQFANEGLSRLYSRLPLREESEILTLAGQDLDMTLDQDVLLVSTILTPYGMSLPIETQPIPKSAYVHGGILHLPGSLGVGELQVTYRKRHPKLTPIVDGADLAQEIVLLPELEEALTAYIASKYYGSMNSQDAVIMAGNYRNRYEQVVMEALNQGLLAGEILPMGKLEARGFV